MATSETETLMTTMLIHRVIAAAALSLTVGTAQADGLKPIQAQPVDLGSVSGIAYYTIEPDGFHVVATLAQGETGTPIRVRSVLASGQSIIFSTPGGFGVEPVTITIAREEEQVVVREDRHNSLSGPLARGSEIDAALPSPRGGF